MSWVESVFSYYGPCDWLALNSVTAFFFFTTLGSGRPGRDGKGSNQQVIRLHCYWVLQWGFVGMLSVLGWPESRDFHLCQKAKISTCTCQFGGLVTLRLCVRTGVRKFEEWEVSMRRVVRSVRRWPVLLFSSQFIVLQFYCSLAGSLFPCPPAPLFLGTTCLYFKGSFWALGPE